MGFGGPLWQDSIVPLSLKNTCLLLSLVPDKQVLSIPSFSELLLLATLFQCSYVTVFWERKCGVWSAGLFHEPVWL